MQERTFGAAGVGGGLAVQGTVIHAFSAQGEAAFAEMNADLVGAAGFESAGHKRESPELFNDFNMSDGFLSVRCCAAAAPTVAPVCAPKWFQCVPPWVGHEPGLDIRGQLYEREIVGPDASPPRACAPARGGRSFPCPGGAPREASRSLLGRQYSGKNVHQRGRQELFVREPSSFASDACRTVVRPAGLSTTAMWASRKRTRIDWESGERGAAGALGSWFLRPRGGVPFAFLAGSNSTSSRCPGRTRLPGAWHTCPPSRIFLVRKYSRTTPLARRSVPCSTAATV